MSEKGRVVLKVSVEMTGGHASTPHPESAIGVLASAIQK